MKIHHYICIFYKYLIFNISIFKDTKNVFNVNERFNQSKNGTME